jgi:hypothetical protein
MKDWKIIINHFDLNDRIQIGYGNQPKLINQSIKLFSTKEELLPQYKKLIDKYMKKSYDWKGHSEGAIKFFYEEKGKDIYTLILVHHKDEEVINGLFE